MEIYLRISKKDGALGCPLTTAVFPLPFCSPSCPSFTLPGTLIAFSPLCCEGPLLNLLLVHLPISWSPVICLFFLSPEICISFWSFSHSFSIIHSLDFLFPLGQRPLFSTPSSMESFLPLPLDLGTITSYSFFVPRSLPFLPLGV